MSFRSLSAVPPRCGSQPWGWGPFLPSLSLCLLCTVSIFHCAEVAQSALCSSSAGIAWLIAMSLRGEGVLEEVNSGSPYVTAILAQKQS